jgi:hypothetical protein
VLFKILKDWRTKQKYTKKLKQIKEEQTQKAGVRTENALVYMQYKLKGGETGLPPLKPTVIYKV